MKRYLELEGAQLLYKSKIVYSNGSKDGKPVIAGDFEGQNSQMMGISEDIKKKKF